jgi:hypothetical protein
MAAASSMHMNLPFELDVIEGTKRSIVACVLHVMDLDLTARVMWCLPAILMYETASLTERLLKLEPYVTEITKILPSHASQVRNRCHHNTVAIQHISRSCARCVASLADLCHARRSTWSSCSSSTRS